MAEAIEMFLGMLSHILDGTADDAT